MASVFLRMGVDPRNERACMRWYNFGLLDSDDEDDMEELEEEPEPVSDFLSFPFNVLALNKS